MAPGENELDTPDIECLEKHMATQLETFPISLELRFWVITRFLQLDSFVQYLAGRREVDSIFL